MDAVMKEVKMGMGRKEEWRLPGLLYGDDLVLFSAEEALKVMVVCWRKGLKVNADKSKVMVFGWRRDWSIRFMLMGCNWSKCQS